MIHPFFIALATVIILGLAAYAGWLLSSLYRQKQQQTKVMNAAISQRNTKIIESVDIIALAALEKQCDFSEAAIRLYMIMSQLQGEMQHNFAAKFPALFELYELIKDMPRGEARKTIPKQARMQLDLVRISAESRLEQSILFELEQILLFTGAKKAPLGH